MLNNDLLRHRLEFARAIDQNQYELSPRGVYFPKQRAFVGGQFKTWINGRDMQIDPNTVPTEGLNYILKSGLTAAAYIAPYTGAVTVTSALTAANFHSTLTEFQDYDEAARQAWTIPADPVGGVFTNEASPAVFTAATAVGTDPGVDIVGAGIIQGASGKRATTGKCICAAAFSGVRNLKTGDKLTVEYSISAESA